MGGEEKAKGRIPEARGRKASKKAKATREIGMPGPEETRRSLRKKEARAKEVEPHSRWFFGAVFRVDGCDMCEWGRGL